jgi:sulfhydrogenase subunit beta (sulfur reductase)
MLAQFLPRAHLNDLIEVLADRGYRTIGPRVRDGAIVYDDIASAADLPGGWHDAQAPGRYQLTPSTSDLYFAWANGPQAIKPHLFAPREPLWRAKKVDDRFEVEAILPKSQPLAFLGVRACDLAALGLQDKLFLGGPYVDPYYGARAQEMLLIAVHCSYSAATCFCASTGDGPRAGAGFDLALTELAEGFVVEVGSVEGQQLLALLPVAEASAQQTETARVQVERAAQSQVRSLPGRNLRDSLFAALDHPRWEEVAARCLSCGNCTMVCPTCFCHAEHDVPALNGAETVHERIWDSCFSAGHAYIHGFQVRPEIKHRYRQWLTHKLGSWHEQFGRSGCVGCGRCITWCPVGIDITEEANAIAGGVTHAA